MNRPIFRVTALSLLLATQVSPSFSQTSSELKNFLSQRLGLSQDQIAATQHGQPFAKNAEPRTTAEIFVIGVIYINAAPESYVKFVSDPGNLRHLPFPEFLAIKNFSNLARRTSERGAMTFHHDMNPLRDGSLPSNVTVSKSSFVDCKTSI